MGLKETIIYQSQPKIFILGCLAAAVLQYSSGPNPSDNQQIKTLKSQIVEDTEKLKQTMEKTANKDKFQEEVSHVSQTVRLALDYLPKDVDIQDLYKKINIEARNAGIQITLFKPKEPVSKDFYDELPIEITLHGSYVQTLMFLSYVSKLPRIINISDVEMTDPTFVEEVPQMNFKGTLVAYRYKEGK